MVKVIARAGRESQSAVARKSGTKMASQYGSLHAEERRRKEERPGVPSVASTPQQLNLLELEPKAIKRTRCCTTEVLAPPAIVGRILGICESSVAVGVHTLLLVLALAYAHASGAAAVGLSFLTLSHPALLYPVVQWYAWRREVACAWQSANLVQKRPASGMRARQHDPQPGQLVHPAFERQQHGRMLSEGSLANAFERQRAQMPTANSSVLLATTWRHSAGTRSPPTARGHDSRPLVSATATAR